MSLKTLRVRARGPALVQSLESLNASPRRYVGREWVVVNGQYGLKSTGEDSEVPNRAEYRIAVKEGSLWAADKATADECGATFDDSFGGEYE